MEAKIKRVVKLLYLQYLIFWLVPILLMVAYETDILSMGLYADDAYMQYILESICVLTTIICVPAALKLFGFLKKRKPENFILPTALDRYLYLCAARLVLLGVATTFNVVISNLTLNNLGGFCALITLIASVFCLPSEKRLRAELSAS